MSRAIWIRVTTGVLVVVALAAVAAGCGDSGSETTGQSAESTTSGGSEAGSTAAAKEKVAPYINTPSPFPVTEKLSELPEGATIAFVDCGLPYCTLLWELAQEPAEMLGVNLERFKTGTAANTVVSTFDSVVAKQPDGVIVIGGDASLWRKQLEELQADEIPVVTQGVAEAAKYGIVSPQSGENQNRFSGELMANYIPAEMDPEAEVVVFETPELSYTREVTATFVAELEAVCPDCPVRTAQIPAATIGTTAPDLVVSDLQAHADTGVAMFTVPEMSVGLPSALATAGIEVETLSYGSVPANLEQIKEGTETAGFGYDTAVATWTLLDQVAREVVGQELTGPQAEGIGVVQFLTQKDITFDPSKGWTGYPDFAERFAKLWGVEN